MHARRRLCTWLMIAVAPGALLAQAPPRPTIRLVAVPDLRDAAVAVADPHQPVIYYNPQALVEMGPELAAFLMAHERGHIARGHQRPAPGILSLTAEQALLRRYEEEADCWATATLSETSPAAVLAAIRYFRNVGHRRADLEHPTGTERAAAIGACFDAGTAAPFAVGP
jgi:hypothetical protein